MTSNPSHEAEIQRLMRLPYHRLISGEPREGYLGEVVELSGCLTAGATPQEAVANLDEAMAAWFEAALLTGMQIPQPLPDPVRLTA